MKKSILVATAVLALALAGCEDHHDHDDDDDHDHHHHDHNVDTRRVVEIFSDRTLDGDITANLATGARSVPSIAANTGNVQGGIDVSSATEASVSETRAFLIFPLGALPLNASIKFASIKVFIDNVSFTTSPTAPIPFLLDSIDTILFPPPIVSSYFDAPFRINKTLSFFGRDAGTLVEIDVTSLLLDAQTRLLTQFEVRFLFDHARFQNETTTPRGLIEIDDGATTESRAPLLHIEFF